jgi:glyoxylate reductase
MLAHARRIPERDAVVRAGGWGQWSPTFLLGQDLHGKTLGVIGLGEIGLAVATRARGFSMPVVYWSRSRKRDLESYWLAWRDLDDLLRESDYVSISVALTPETRHLIGSRELALMKAGAVLVNTARGAIVDQEALIEALVRGHLGGAALDVFSSEPPTTDDRLLRLENVLLSPHAGSATIETRTRMTDLAVDNLLAFFQGRRPSHCVNA